MSTPARAYHDGKTPANWAGSMAVLVGFVVGSVGFLLGPNWIVVAVGAAIVVLGLIVGWGMSIAGLGAVPRR